MNFLYEPFSNKVFINIIRLITDTNLTCNTEELPRYGVAIEDLNGLLLGYVGAHRKYGTVAHIDILVVNSGTRDKGIGTLLINKICTLLFKEGCTDFTAEVEAENSKAIHLYLKLGAKLSMSYKMNLPVDKIIKNTNELLNNFN